MKTKRNIKCISLATLCIFIVIGIFTLYACANGQIEYHIGFSDLAIFGSKENEDGGIAYGLTKTIKSVEELRDVCEEWNNPAFDENSDGYSSELSQKIRGYDEKFFETKALIINSSLQYNSESVPKVEKLTHDGDVLIIQVSLKDGMYWDIAEGWLFLIEVNKTYMDDITYITIENTTRAK